MCEIPAPEPEPAAPPRSGEDVTERLARRGTDGFGPLYERLAPAVWAWARLRVPTDMRAQLDPDDVAQEAWTRAYRSFATYDPALGPFRPWLFQVAKHTLLDMIRRVRVRRPEGGRLVSDSRLDELRDDVTNLSRRLARDDAVRYFLDRSRSLPDAERMLLVHCGLEGMSVKEAAQRIGLGREAAYKRWQRLRARLSAPGGMLGDL